MRLDALVREFVFRNDEDRQRSSSHRSSGTRRRKDFVVGGRIGQALDPLGSSLPEPAQVGFGLAQAGLGVGTGLGFGVGTGVGVGAGLGLGVGAGFGVGAGLGLGVGTIFGSVGAGAGSVGAGVGSVGAAPAASRARRIAV